ncbi:MAG: hypothetical protein ACKO0Z_19500 [Betaproteobacteria bacterium]
MQDIKYLKKAVPTIPAAHRDFKWTNGSDVQALWRRFGWTPPSERITPPPAPAEDLLPKWARARRVK